MDLVVLSYNERKAGKTSRVARNSRFVGIAILKGRKKPQ